MKILIIDDDRSTAESLRSGLSAATHTVEIADDGAEGSFLARSYAYDAILLDYSLPKKNGLDVCKEVRAAGRATPILFLSVTGDTSLKVSALELGADDYMTKPFSFEELSARLRAVARRPQVLKKDILQVADLVLDASDHSIRRDGREIYLTRKESSLLEYLMSHPGVVLSRALLLEHVWTADSDPLSNTVEAHLRNLRKKINAGGKPNLIHNVPGRGYMIRKP